MSLEPARSCAEELHEIGAGRDGSLLPLAAGADALLACRARTCALSPTP
ncbi:MAG: hypothetical protein ACYDH5_05465 [Acidimicrobiales bacterium]